MPDEQNKLARLNPDSAVATTEPSVGLMLQQVIQHGVSEQNIGAVEKLVALYERMQDRQAEKDFAAAFVKLRAEIPRIQALKAVPNNDGTVRYCFAPLEEIDAQAGPICLKHGFTYTFSEAESPAGKITKLCILQHVGGHKRSNPFTVRIGSGPPKSSESQADGAAHTYAKRGALCDCLGIVITHQDTDARTEGAPITDEQAADLKRRVHATGSNEVFFLKFAGANSYAEIASAKYDMLDASLRKKENTK